MNTSLAQLNNLLDKLRLTEPWMILHRGLGLVRMTAEVSSFPTVWSAPEGITVHLLAEAPTEHNVVFVRTLNDQKCKGWNVLNFRLQIDFCLDICSSVSVHTSSGEPNKNPDPVG